MAKSRSRSPRWKHRPPLHRSPEQHRQRHYSDEGFRRDARRPIHWEEDRHGQNNPRIVPHNRFNDKLYEQNLFPPKIRKSPLEPADRLRRIYSPERHGESSRRFPTKYPEDVPHRDNDRNLDHHRNQGRNLHDDANGFRIGRREDSFHGPHRREPDWERGENGDHWKQEGHRDQHALPYRRNSQERGIFPKRYPEDRNFKEPGQGPKRLRETERLEHRPLPRNPHWKPDHVFRPSEGKDWSKTSDFRNPSPLVHRANSGEFTKIEYDYSHKSPSYVGMDLPFPDDFVDKHNRNEERKPVNTKNSHDGNILDSHTRERGKYSSERLLDSSTKYSSKKYHNSDRDNLKNEMESKHQNYKYKERGRNNSVPHKESIPPTDQLDQSSNCSVSKPALNNTSSMETITVNLNLKKQADKYRSDINSTDRQLSHDLVVSGRKETFRPVFEHLDSTTVGAPEIPKTEFTQEIITIIHEVKANHFKSADLTLHERFSKLQAESNKQDLNLNKIPPQTNPEIHRRIDISLEDLQNKSINRIDVPLSNKRVIEDPHDLRHDIERRRKERLQGDENGGNDVGFQEREASNSYYRPQNHETGEYHRSRQPRPPFRKSTGQPSGSYYRGKTSQSYPPQSSFENTDEIRRPYKGRGNAAMGL